MDNTDKSAQTAELQMASLPLSGDDQLCDSAEQISNKLSDDGVTMASGKEYTVQELLSKKKKNTCFTKAQNFFHVSS